MPVLQRSLRIIINPRQTVVLFPNFIPLLSFSTSETQNPPPVSSFIVNYLTKSCGFSPEKAISMSTNLTHIKSPQRPDSVLSFFRNCGLSYTNIRFLISLRPQFLSSNVERTLLPKVKILRELGLSSPCLAELLVSNPRLLIMSAQPSINFFKPLLQTKEDMIKVLKKSKWLLSPTVIENRIQLNITILRNCGVSSHLIATLLARNPNFFFRSPSWVKRLISRVEEMGLPCQNGMFVYALFTVGSMTEAVLEAKFNLFKSYGWSEVDILSAFAKAPEYVKYSERKIRETMDYLMNELACDPSFVVLYPKLLSYSLEKRIIPRCNVVRILRSKELLNKNPNLYSVVCLSEKKFLKRFIHPYIEIAPDICQEHVGYI